MNHSHDIRRRPDGWIDIDYYRQAAARERQEAIRRAFDRCVALCRSFGERIANFSSAGATKRHGPHSTPPAPAA